MQESETLRKDGGALSNKRPPRILVVDDDSRLRDLLRQFLPRICGRKCRTDESSVAKRTF